MVLWSIVLVISLLALVKSADSFTEGAEELGVFLGVPLYVIGVTVVAIGTSLPELVSSLFAAARGAPEVVVGNAVGSNVANISLILGIAAITGGRLLVRREIVHIDLPMLAASAALLGLTALDGQISRGDGVLLFAGAVIFVIYAARTSGSSETIRTEVTEDVARKVPVERGRPRVTMLLKLVLGGVVLYFGAEYTIRSVIELSTRVGIGADILAISAVALGTSLPELAVSVSAARRGKVDIAIGNILGSNAFNSFAVVGIPALIVPLPVTSSVLYIGLPFMAVTTVLYFFMWQDREVTRWEGMPLVIIYALFLARLFGLF